MVKELEEVLIENETEVGYSLVLWNDDFNSFDSIIQALIELLSHRSEQAEQCAMIRTILKTR